MRHLLIIALYACVFTVAAAAQPAPHMATSVFGTGMSFDQCRSRAIRVLEGEGYGGLRDFGNGWIGVSGSVSGSLGCIHGQSGTVVVVTTAAAGDARAVDARDRLVSAMRGNQQTGNRWSWRAVCDGMPYTGTFEIQVRRADGTFTGTLSQDGVDRRWPISGAASGSSLWFDRSIAEIPGRGTQRWSATISGNSLSGTVAEPGRSDCSLSATRQ